MLAVSSVYVRHVTIDDLILVPKATVIANQSFGGAEGSWTSEADMVKTPRCTEEIMGNYIKNNGSPDTLLFAFEKDSNKLVGMIMIQPSRDEAELSLYCVSPQHQSQGIGGQLLRTAMETAKSSRFTAVFLHTTENRPDIIAMYQKAGFQEFGERNPFNRPEILKLDKELCRFVNLKKRLI